MIEIARWRRCPIHVRVCLVGSCGQELRHHAKVLAQAVEGCLKVNESSRRPAATNGQDPARFRLTRSSMCREASAQAEAGASCQ